jgi:hypothetical protein
LDGVAAVGSTPEPDEPTEPAPRNDEAASVKWSSALGRAEFCAPPETVVGAALVGVGGGIGMPVLLIGAPIGTSGARSEATPAPALGGAADAGAGARGDEGGALDGGTEPNTGELCAGAGERPTGGCGGRTGATGATEAVPEGIEAAGGGVGRRPGTNGGTRVGVGLRGMPGVGAMAAPGAAGAGIWPDSPRPVSPGTERSAAAAEAPVGGRPAPRGEAVRLAAS